MDTKTLDYYNKNASSFVSDTVFADVLEIQNKFLNKLKKGSRILDFGCGSGRDTRYFLESGYLVEAVDGSEELCRLAQNYTGIEVKRMLFQDLDAVQRYDGIWACSSVLHLPKSELKPVFEKMAAALKEGGVIYTSFKYGSFEGTRNERYFTDFTIESFMDFLQEVQCLEIEEAWITKDVRPARDGEKWLNLMLRQNQTCKSKGLHAIIDGQNEEQGSCS